VPYFEDHLHRLNLKVESDTQRGLRECQLGAYWAVLAHFTTTSVPGLVSLPTGSGKTALMQILSFGLAAKKVLIIEPTVILRDQIAEEFSTGPTLKLVGVLPKNLPNPRVLSREGRFSRKAEWDALRKFDVVVVTPHTSSPEQPGVVKPPDDLFDLVFIDEAHHTSAPTWAALLSAFHNSRRILLTATPFRRDKRRLGANLIYSYPIARALEKHVYRPVKYHPVSVQKTSSLDEELSKTAKRVLLAERKLGNDSKMLVRTDRVEKAQRLIDLYKKQAIDLREVDYEKRMEENQKALDAVKRGKADGIVCVGMVGEGLDLPALKIAVLHHSPRSLPFTLQFVGRVARFVPAQVGDAHLIASPDEVRGEVRKLYREDTDWRKLIPELVDHILGKVGKLKHIRLSSPLGYLDLNPLDLKPFHSVRVYPAKPKDLDIESDIEFDEDIQTCFTEIDSSGQTLTIVTETERTPPWAKETSVTQIEYDLHIYYYDSGAQLLFEFTSSDEIASAIRAKISSRDLEFLSPRALLRAMKEADSGDYLMVGLRNVAAPSASQPTYKTLMGSQVQAAVRLTDGRIFAPGHALAAISKTETRGIGSMQGRIWAIKRSKLPDFISWCKTIAVALARTTSPAGLPQIDFLARSSALSALTERPLAVVFDDSLLQADVSIFVEDGQHIVRGDVFPSIEITSFTTSTDELNCKLHFSSSATPLDVRCKVSDRPIWKLTDTRTARLRAEFNDDNIYDGDLGQFLNQFLPTLVCPDAGVILGATKWTPNLTLGDVPTQTLTPRNWQGCDIRHEVHNAKKGKLNVQEWTLKELKAASPKNAIIISDHGSGEIADFIVIDQEQNPKTLTMYHCKASERAKPSTRVGDFYEVLQQACRSAQWTKSPALMRELVVHTDAPRNSPILRGTKQDLRDVESHYRCNEWKFRVVAVQPGCACSKVSKSPRVYPLVVATYQWLLDVDSEFSIWGS
jgi:superfamily II DNA or RNA helicase